MSDVPVGDRWTLDRLLSEVIGSGPKSAEDMSREQARDAFEQILDHEVDPTTLGAFFLANRWKGNTPEELAAYVDILRERSEIPAREPVDAVDCGANYDGKRETAILGVGAGLVAAAAGTPVVVHAADGVPTKYGATYTDVLAALSIETEISPRESAAMLEDIGFGYYYQPAFHPRLHDLLSYRERMAVRTFVNTIETLLNPANATTHLGSFYHLTFATKVIAAIAESESVTFDRVIMMQGVEGYDDIRPGYTQLAEWTGEEVRDFSIETDDFGLELTGDDLVVEDVARDSARITAEVLAGHRDGHFADAIALNAAVRLYAGETVDSIAAGIDLARETIDTGEPHELLEELRSRTVGA